MTNTQFVDANNRYKKCCPDYFLRVLFRLDILLSIHKFNP